MSTLLAPTRFQLNREQMGAALALAGLCPSHRSNLPDLPTTTQPAALLQTTGMLTNGQQPGLTDEAIAALRVTADPLHLLSVVANPAGVPTWVETIFAHSADDGPFVAHNISDDSFDLALVPSATQATLLIDDLLGLTAFVSQPGEAPIPLRLIAYGAVLAAADALQTARLSARMARERVPEPVLTPDRLERALHQGLSGTDTRWAVTAARMVCPGDLRRVSGHLAEGLAALQHEDLVNPHPEGYVLTPTGYTLTRALGQIMTTGGLSYVLTVDGGRLRVGHVSVFRCATAIWVALWTSVTDADATVELMEVSATGALDLVRRLLEPPGVPQTARRCPHCGSTACLDRNFCTRTGKPMPVNEEEVASRLPVDTTCPACGQPLAGGKNFCTRCGERIA